MRAGMYPSPARRTALWDDLAMTWNPNAARTYIYSNGRLLEQLTYAALFEGGSTAAVVSSLSAYRNDDGGFGHGLEPDKRAPASQPLDVEIAFERLVMVDARAVDIVESACAWLATVAAPNAAVPILLPSVGGYPRAEHFEAVEYAPDLNPTAAIAAHAHALAVTHPWVDHATEYCFGEVEAGRIPAEAHAILALTRLVQTAPDRGRAELAARNLASALPTARFLKLDHESETYGVTPLEFAPTPDSIARSWFDDEILQGHLDQLERQQQPDGGWPISWRPPSEAAVHEWRAIRTLHAVNVLAAYDRAPIERS